MILVALSCSHKDQVEDTSTAAPQTKPSTQVDASKEKALESEFSALPQSVIIAVPLDERGNELLDQAVMKTQSGSEMVVDANVDATFANAKSPAKIGKGELDGDSSTQSWQPWQPNQNGYQGQNGQVDQSNANSINIGNINNSNVDVNVSQNNNYYQNQSYQGGSGYYSNYRPWAYSTQWTGNYWGYSRPWCFQRPQIHYYVYPRQCSSFSFCSNGNSNWW